MPDQQPKKLPPSGDPITDWALAMLFLPPSQQPKDPPVTGDPAVDLLMTVLTQPAAKVSGRAATEPPQALKQEPAERRVSTESLIREGHWRLAEARRRAVNEILSGEEVVPTDSLMRALFAARGAAKLG